MNPEAALAEIYRPTAEPQLGRLMLANPELSRNREAEQRYDLTTLFAEQVDGSMKTTFNLRFTGEDLLGEGEDSRGMGEIFQKALDDAKQMAAENPSLEFEVRRRELEMQEHMEMVEMAQGKGPNTMVKLSDCPKEVLEAKKDILGYSHTRKKAMMRVIYRNDNGSLNENEIPMDSQSLDGSNRIALEAIFEHLGAEAKPGELLGQSIRIDLPAEKQTGLSDELRDVYDQSMTEQFGGVWFAGRRPADYRNTYDFVCRQTDIVDECIRLDQLGWLNESYLYKMVAALQQRFNENLKTGQEEFVFSTSDLAKLHRQIDQAGAWATQNNMVFSGCGVSLSSGGRSGLLKNGLKLAGYGNLGIGDEDEYGSRTFKCPSCSATNRRGHNELLSNCQHCNSDAVAC